MSGVIAVLGVRAIIGAALLTAAILKFSAMGVFEAVLALSGLVPGPAVPLVAWAVSISEAGVGLLLLTSAMLSPVLVERALWGAAMLLTAYVTYDVVRITFGAMPPGPYFGVWSAVHPAVAMAIAAVMLSVVVVLLGRTDTSSFHSHPGAAATTPKS
jgi:hypothetical protein